MICTALAAAWQLINCVSLQHFLQQVHKMSRGVPKVLLWSARCNDFDSFYAKMGKIQYFFICEYFGGVLCLLPQQTNYLFGLTVVQVEQTVWIRQVGHLLPVINQLIKIITGNG